VWTGDFTIDAEGIVTGTEELFWSPKPEWEADPNILVAQTACTVVYNVDGTSQDSTQCSSCDYAIEATAFRDESASTCPLDVLQELVPDTYELEYHVRIGDNNAADVYFPSMNLMDGPYAMANDQFFVFTTPPACWFH
jgi:hypothetical protein